jgi:glutathione synthase/RimK-type ligase-like ATP-grasp enzyme
MKPIAFVTEQRFPDLLPGDRLAAQAVQQRGRRVVPAQWDDPAVDWSSFDAVVLRSPWDYFHHFTRFTLWLDLLQALDVPLLNPLSLVRWNLDKVYLGQLERRGVRIPRTSWTRPAEDADSLWLTLPNEESARPFAKSPGSLARLLEDSGLTEAVIKPTISANAYETFRVNPQNAAAHEESFWALATRKPLLVQAFVSEVASLGESSLIYFSPRRPEPDFDGFSHAVQKRPAPGDFRVQETHGGTLAALTPSAALREAAQKTLAAVEGPWLYARVDLVESAEGPLLMELEVIEPELFFPYGEDAPRRFAAALLSFLA